MAVRSALNRGMTMPAAQVADPDVPLKQLVTERTPRPVEAS